MLSGYSSLCELLPWWLEGMFRPRVWNQLMQWRILTCITNRWPEMLFPYSASRASVAKRTPLPVAASLPREPPRSCHKTRNGHCQATFKISFSATTHASQNIRSFQVLVKKKVGNLMINKITCDFHENYFVLEHFQGLFFHDLI